MTRRFGPHLWINYKTQEGREFGGNNVPRGTLLWNGNQQTLVCVEKILLEKDPAWIITCLSSGISVKKNLVWSAKTVGLRYVSQPLFCA
jgi:hypothetical protein